MVGGPQSDAKVNALVTEKRKYASMLLLPDFLASYIQLAVITSLNNVVVIVR